MTKEVIELPVAWIKRLQDYITAVKSPKAGKLDKDSSVDSLIGYLESLDMFIK